MKAGVIIFPKNTVVRLAFVVQKDLIPDFLVLLKSLLSRRAVKAKQHAPIHLPLVSLLDSIYHSRSPTMLDRN
jgi:hypothetical protein